MPSNISETMGKFELALNESRLRVENIRKEGYKNSEKFYKEFFKDLVIKYNFNYPKMKMVADQLFQTDKVRFAAVDGSCYKRQLIDYMVFFGASYSIRGILDFTQPKNKFYYEPWSPEEDVSMVAYVPVPFAELRNSIEDPFIVEDEALIDLSNIHLQLMQLAEVFQNYMLVKSSDLRPKILLWDHSMSSVLMSNTLNHNWINLIGKYKHSMRYVTAQDVIIAYSHPYNESLGVPSTKKYGAYNYILWKIQESPQKISKLASDLNVSEEKVIDRINYLTNDNLKDNDLLLNSEPLAYLEGDKLFFNPDYDGSWEYSLNLFENICSKLFKDKKPDALIYKNRDHEGIKERWFSPNDIKFLISIGLRALIEECWKRNVLLIGIVKDSSSRYLSRNYLGITSHTGIYKHIPKVRLPLSDRDFLENLVWIDDEIESPWSTIEFDSVFMTLHMERDTANNPIMKGVKGNIVEPTENLFTRSLAQFYINRSKKIPLYGHVIFIDRLINPNFDRNAKKVILDQNMDELGVIKPIIFIDKNEDNPLQELTMYILNLLTRNLFPQVIGYPDPLHEADWGAKSLYKNIKPIIDSSDISLRANPMHKTLRQLRDGIH